MKAPDDQHQEDKRDRQREREREKTKYNNRKERNQMQQVGKDQEVDASLTVFILVDMLSSCRASEVNGAASAAKGACLEAIS